MIEIANTPAFRQIGLTLAFFPDIALHPNFQHFVEATEDHFQQLEGITCTIETDEKLRTATKS